MNKEQGKLIVFEGIDGCGKATQSEIFLKRLHDEGYSVTLAWFPRYDRFFGKMVGGFLRGEFGVLNEVDPHLAAHLYAADRWQAKEDLLSWLSQGMIIVCDRYVTSNAAHQTTRVPTEEKEKFLRWLEEMEYQVFGIPREDLVVFLDVPLEIAQALVEKKASRSYLNGGSVDILEADREHLREAREMYLLLAGRNNNWVQISCCDENGNLLTPEEIHELVWAAVKEKI